MARRVVESRKIMTEDLKSQVKKLADVVKKKETELSDSAKQIKVEKDRQKALIQARNAVSKELAKALKDKSDLEETLKANVEELNKAKIIKFGLGSKQAKVNLPRLNEKDLDEDDLQLLKSPTVTVLKEAKKDLTEKLIALENKLIAEVELRESLENEMKEDKSRMELTAKTNEALVEEVGLLKNSLLSLEKEKNELMVIKEKCGSLEKSLLEEIEQRKSADLKLESMKQESLNLEKQVIQQSEKCDVLDEARMDMEMKYKETLGISKENEAMADKTKIELDNLKKKYVCLEKEKETKEINGLQSKLSKLESENDVSYHAMNEVDDLHAELAATEKENNAVIETLEEEVNIWKGKFEDLEKEKEILQKENDGLQQQLGGLEKNNDAVLEIWRKDDEEWRNKLSNLEKEKDAALEKMKNDNDVALNILRKESTDWKEKFSCVVKKKDASLELLKKEVDEWREKVFNLEKEKNVAVEIIQENRDVALDILRREGEEWKEKFCSVEKEKDVALEIRKKEVDEWNEKLSSLEKVKDAALDLLRKEVEDWQEKFNVIKKTLKDETGKLKDLETELIEFMLKKLETEMLELDTKIVLAEKDLILNRHKKIQSLKQKVEELQNSVEKGKDGNRIVENERDKFKSLLDELWVFRDKYDVEKKRQDLEREFDVFKPSDKLEGPSEEKLTLKEDLQSHASEIKDLHGRAAKQKEKLRSRIQAFEELKVDLKKRSLSNNDSQRNPEDLQGQSKFKKMETNSDVSTTRIELQEERWPSTTLNVNLQNKECSSIEAKLDDLLTKHEKERTMLEETISGLKADLFASRERHKVLGQARITIAKELSKALDDLKVNKRKTQDQEELIDFLKLEVKSLKLRLDGILTCAGDSELCDRSNEKYEDTEKNTKEIDLERESRKREELIDMKKVIIDKTKLLDKANEELVSCREIINANHSNEVTSPVLLQELNELKVEVTSLKIERDKILHERETTINEFKKELETKEKKEMVLENNIKDLKSEIRKLMKLEQTKQDLLNKLNDAHMKKFENVQSIHRSSEEKRMIEIERLKKEIVSLTQKLENAKSYNLKEKNEVESLRSQLSELGDRLNKMYEDMEKKSKEIDQERERRKEKEEELIEMKKVIIDKTELLDKANEELVSCREIMNANQPIEVTSPDLLQELGDLKIEVNSLKIERDKIVQEQEATKKELEIELETKEKKEKVLENDIKDLESEISKLKKLEQDNQDLVNEVGEVQNKLNSALTDIESANKLNEAHLEKFENLQSLHKSSEEKLKMEIERLKNELSSLRQKLENSKTYYLKEKNEVESLRSQLSELSKDLGDEKSKNETLEEKTNNICKEKEEEMKKNVKIQMDLTKLSKNLEESKVSLDYMKNEFENAEKSIEALKAEVDEAAEHAKHFEKIIKDLREELKVAKTEATGNGHAVCNKKIETLEKNNKKLKKTIAILTKDGDESDDEGENKDEDSKSNVKSVSSSDTVSIETCANTSQSSVSTNTRVRPVARIPASHNVPQQLVQPSTRGEAVGPVHSSAQSSSSVQVCVQSGSTVQPVSSSIQSAQSSTHPVTSQDQPMGEMYDVLVEALMEAKAERTTQELQGKYNELLSNLLNTTNYTRDQIVPILDRAFAEVFPVSSSSAPPNITVSVHNSIPTISIPELITPGAASTSAIRRGNPPVYQEPSTNQQSQNMMSVHQAGVQVGQGAYIRQYSTPAQPLRQVQQRRAPPLRNNDVHLTRQTPPPSYGQQ